MVHSYNRKNNNINRKTKQIFIHINKDHHFERCMVYNFKKKGFVKIHLNKNL